jgi:hypothetical protein
VQFFDVRDPANPKLVATIDETNHTSECALDCSYTYGSGGTIIDARGVLDGKTPTVIGNWIDALKKDGINERSCHHIREIRPGVMLTACQPFVVFTINADEGGSPTDPKVLATGIQDEFVHSARWPRGGTDKFLLTGGEENFTARCENNTSDFITWNAEQVLNGQGKQFQKLDSVEPAGNGVYADGKPVAGALGCSVHWFQEHPSFKNGGLVALASYDNGMRFLQIKPDGKIVEQGYFQPLGFETSAPRWVPGTNIVYSIDYARGIDILRWKGDTYVPSASGKVKHKKGKVRGTNGKQPLLPALTAAQRAFATREVSLLRAQGWFQGNCELAARRYGTAS